MPQTESVGDVEEVSVEGLHRRGSQNFDLKEADITEL